MAPLSGKWRPFRDKMFTNLEWHFALYIFGRNHTLFWQDIRLSREISPFWGREVELRPLWAKTRIFGTKFCTFVYECNVKRFSVELYQYTIVNGPKAFMYKTIKYCFFIFCDSFRQNFATIGRWIFVHILMPHWRRGFDVDLIFIFYGLIMSIWRQALTSIWCQFDVKCPLGRGGGRM